MNAKALICLVGIVSLSACATPFRPPRDLAHVTLTRGDSPVVRVDKIWLERKHDLLVVRGYVVKRIDANDTTQTHLDVTLYGAGGTILRSFVANFEPRQIPHRHRHQAIGTYRVPLDPLPTGTARIEVRAHEGAHPST